MNAPPTETLGSRRTVPDHVPANLVHDFDIYEDEGIRRDLHREYSRLHREAPPIFWTPLNGGHWIVTRHDAIATVNLDTEHFSTREHEFPRVPDAPRFIPLHYDPPENMPYRKLLMPFFSPKAVKAMDAQIRAHAARLIDDVKDKGACEFIEDIAAPFPVKIFMTLMGLPLERYDDFRGMVVDFFTSQGSDRMNEVIARINGEIEALVADRRANPRDDLITRIVNAEIEGRPIHDWELLNMTFLLLLGGLDTVTNMLTFTIHRLAQEPQLQERLLREPERMADFVEEGLRLFGVVNTPRIVKKDVDLMGVPFRVDDMVMTALPMAGWDDTANPNPTVFDIDRVDRKHLTFSTGAHLCLGHYLARTELKIFFSTWMEKIGKFRLKPGQEFHYRGGTVMALESLELEWDVKG